MGQTPSSDVELVLDLQLELGEGPVWDERTGELLFVDILQGDLHRFRPADGRHVQRTVGSDLGSLGLRESRGLVLALREGFALLDDLEGEPRLVERLHQDGDRLRFNDGCCDARGRFLAGSTGFAHEREAGTLYRLDPSGAVTPLMDGLTISNGIDWSPDERTMYLVDGPRRLLACDWDADAGSLGAPRELVRTVEGEGEPDGLTVDEEGYVWLAVWGAWEVRRYAPDGALDRTLRLPVSQVTSLAFGGDDLRDLYVTSARIDLGGEQLEREPLAGGLFRLRPGVRGRLPNRFAG